MSRAGLGLAALGFVLSACAVVPVASTTRGPQDTSTSAAASPGPADRADGAERTRRQPADPDPEPSAQGAALTGLDTLAVKGRAPMTGYDRAAFGPDWYDADGNGCDTRNDLLRRHLSERRHDPAPRGCVVVSGVLDDPYTGARIQFVLGDGFAVDVDHVVALGNAWATGAAYWSVRERTAFANDPLNLLPVDAAANRQKGDGDAATWLPPDKGYRCRYVARQVAVKATYGLWVTSAESAAIRRVLGGCPQQRLPEGSGAPLRVRVEVHARPKDPGGASYENCAAAAAAGAAPVRRGDTGYGPHLDGDGDGTACE